MVYGFIYSFGLRVKCVGCGYEPRVRVQDEVAKRGPQQTSTSMNR